MPRGNPAAYSQSRFRRQARRDEQTGREAEDEYLTRARGFDADEAAGRSAKAQFDTFREDLAEDLGDLRGEQVGAGRLDTGYRFDDEDELIEGGIRDLNRGIAGRAVQTAGMNLRNTEGIGQYGQDTTGRYLDILGSERDADLQLEEMRRKDEANRKKGMFGLAGRVGGTLLGPAGDKLGGRLGEALDSLLS